MMIYTARSKPPAGTDLDNRVPLTRELVQYFPINEGAGRSLNNLGPGRGVAVTLGSTAGTPQWAANVEGVLLRWPAGGNWGWAVADVRDRKERKATYMVFFAYEQNVNFPVVLTECNSGINTPQIQLYLEANGKLALFLRDDANVNVNPAAIGPGVVDNVFHQGTLVLDGGSAYLYLDGVLLRTQTIAALGNITTDQLIIGAARAAGNQHRGSISQVMVWRRALSQDEIVQLFQYPYSMLKVNHK